MSFDRPRGLWERKGERMPHPEAVLMVRGGKEVIPASTPEECEDGAYLALRKGFAAVMDGISGRGKSGTGKRAEEMARGRLEEFLQRFDDFPRGTLIDVMRRATREIRNVFHSIDHELNSYASERNLEHFGTTLVLVKFVRYGKEMKAIIAHSGDSRAYWYGKGGVLRKKKLKLLTLDDGYLGKLVEEGRLHERKAFKVAEKLDNTEPAAAGDLKGDEKFLFENRNVLKRSLGTGNVIVHIKVIDVKEGDEILLCSDGLSEGLLRTEIERGMARPGEPAYKARRLAQEAEESGRKHDDIAAAILAVRKDG